MDGTSLIQALLAFAFVLGLIGLAAWLARKAGLPDRFMHTKASAKRLGISDALYLDPKRRLLLVRRDGKEHLLLLGPAGDVVVETDIVPPPAEKKDRAYADA